MLCVTLTFTNDCFCQDVSPAYEKISSGHIGDRVVFSSFNITLADRQSNKSGSAVTFAFSPSAGGAIPASGTVTLNHPTNFFATSPTPSVSTSGSANLNCTAQAAGFVVLTVQAGTVPALVALTVTLQGLTMGSGTPSVPSSISVTTSHDAGSAGVATFDSGPIGDRVVFTSFAVSLSDRVAGKSGSAATVVFAPSVGGNVPVGGTVTLSYPASFFLIEATPSASASGGSALNVTTHASSFLVLSVQSGVLAAATAVTITLAGLKMGSITADVPSSVSVVTSSDSNSAIAMKIPSGHIGFRAALVSFVISDADRLESKSGSAATFTFVPSAGGAIAAGGTLTLCYPPLFFETTAWEPPTFNCSAGAVAGVAAYASAGQSCIVLTTSGSGVIAASQPAVITLFGLKIGPSTIRNVSGISISTSQDQVVSLPIDSGAVVTRLTLLLFAIKFSDAVAGKLDSSAIITFRTSVGGAVAPGGQIIVKYFAKGFFDISQVPLFSCSVPSVSGTCAFDTSSASFSLINVTTGGSGTIPGNTVVTITLAGLTMGAKSDGGPVVVDTSADHESLPVNSGQIYSRQYVRFANECLVDACVLPWSLFLCRLTKYSIRWGSWTTSSRTACSTTTAVPSAQKIIRGATQVRRALLPPWFNVADSKRLRLGP